ncbi:MAG: TetR/AcrR family transcriptional regulator [Bacteroidetes bacterium]|nr:TetR/AcrR family transcriptional regulator [Bacteroidota bacterium]
MPRTLNYSYDELVQKAQHLFWVEGYKTITPENLAEHLDVSVSTIRNKFTKEMLFMDSLEDYINNCSDPVLDKIRYSTKGLEAFRDFFNLLIDALYDKTFPRSCYMANTVVELRNENEQVCKLYERYFGNMRDSYQTVLKRAIKMNEIKYSERIDEYTDFLMGIVFGISILFKVKSREELKIHINEQISLIE